MPGTWNLTLMPRWMRANDFSAVMFSPAKRMLAAAGLVLAEDQPEQRALAGAVRTDQAMDFAGFEREVDVVGDVQAAEMLVEPVKFPGATSGVTVRCGARRAGEIRFIDAERPARPAPSARSATRSSAHDHQRVLAAVDGQGLEGREHHQRADQRRGEIASRRRPRPRSIGSAAAVMPMLDGVMYCPQTV